MALQRVSHPSIVHPLGPMFLFDRRDRRPGTHFAAELGPRLRESRKAAPSSEITAEIDEDLGCCAFGIDLPFLPRD